MADGHRFGGGWTDLKLEVLQEYLTFFTTVLRKQNFELLYIDGFAGSGGRIVERVIARGSPLFGTLDQSEKIDVPGSAKIALETKPSFHRIILIERHNRRFAELTRLCSQYPEIRVQALQGEANEAISDLCRTTRWRTSTTEHRGIRGVLFLDPYGMNVEYETLKTIAKTRAVDVWYLFPLSGVYRQAARSGHKLTPSKKAAITRILGTDAWEAEFYTPPAANDLFSVIPTARRTASVATIEAYVKNRLENIFPTVSKPLRLSMSNGTPLFSLFFAMSNPDPKAIGLALRGANHILKSGISSHTRPRN